MPKRSKPKRKMFKVDNDELHNGIPDELWLRILSYLSISDICRVGATSWRYKDPSLWKDLVFDWPNVKLNLKSINKVLERAIKVEKLRFTCKSDNTKGVPDEKTMTSVVERVKDTLKVLILDDEIVPKNGAVVKFGCLSKLEVLDFPGNKVLTSGVNAIAKLKNLRELKISAACEKKIPACEKVTSKDLSHLFHELKNLVVVDLTDCEDAVTNETIETLAKNNPNLENLVLGNCYKLRGSGLSPLGDNCKKLKCLSVVGCDVRNFRNIAKNCPELRHLNRNCPKLLHLDVFGCHFLSEKIVVQCKDLKYICTLGILNVTDQFVDKLRKEYPGLKIEN